MKYHKLKLLYRKYSKKELEENSHLFNEDDWYYISMYQELPESFIEKYKDKVNWIRISEYQVLSEYFIEKHKGKVYWHSISFFQNLTAEFIRKHIDKISYINILNNQLISQETKKALAKEMELLQEII